MIVSEYTKKLFSNYIVYMKCYKPSLVSGKNVYRITGKGFLKEDNNMGAGSINDIDKKVDMIQQKLQNTKLQPLQKKLRTIKLAL